jgi:hypothetical protein
VQGAGHVGRRQLDGEGGRVGDPGCEHWRDHRPRILARL